MAVVAVVAGIVGSVDETREVELESPFNVGGVIALKDDRGVRSEDTESNDAVEAVAVTVDATSPAPVPEPEFVEGEDIIALALRIAKGDLRRTLFSFTTVSSIVLDMLISFNPDSSCCR